MRMLVPVFSRQKSQLPFPRIWVSRYSFNGAGKQESAKKKDNTIKEKESSRTPE
jgi:hypothetical protein